MALSAPRDTKTKDGIRISAPVKGATTIHQGAQVARDANGFIVPAAIATTLKAAGRACESVVNSGADGASSITYERGVFNWKNSAGGDEITRADIGNNAYMIDDETVAKTHNGNTRSIAGKIIDVDAYGVWVSSIEKA